jgi:hypothetical protein
MPTPLHSVPNPNLHLADALASIKKILESTHPSALPGEKLVRIASVIGALPADLRDTIINEAKDRLVRDWAAGRKPTDF